MDAGPRVADAGGIGVAATGVGRGSRRGLLAGAGDGAVGGGGASLGSAGKRLPARR